MQRCWLSGSRYCCFSTSTAVSMWMHSVLPPTPPSLASLLSAFVLPLYTRFPFFPFFFSFFFFTVTRRLSDLLENQYTKRRVAPCLRDTSSSLSLFFFLHDFSFRRRTLLARRRKQQQQFVSVLLLLLLSVVISVQLAAYSLFSKLHLLFLSFFFFFCNPRSLSHVVLRNAFIACLLDFSLFFHCYYYFSHISLLFS